MRSRSVHPDVQRLLDEAEKLPQCGARVSLSERAAALAETLGDLDTAWSSRCAIIHSSSSHQAPRFETLFLCLAWCLAVSDRDPQRFPATHVLWEYKWAVAAAVNYSSIPRGALERMLEDMDQRFIRAGWGRRAGFHKKAFVFRELGDSARAESLIEPWRTTARDRGSDCQACEASAFSDFLISFGQVDSGLREARPIISGRLKCSTVPHSTFGDLLLPLLQLGRIRDARDIFERGRRLIATMEESAATLSAPYMTFAAASGATEIALGILNARIREGIELPSDQDRMNWFLHTALTLEILQDGRNLDEDLLPGAVRVLIPEGTIKELSASFRSRAFDHAAALNSRNGNRFQSERMQRLSSEWLRLADSARK